MAKAFPKSTFVGYDYHAPSIEVARQRAKEADVRRVVYDVSNTPYVDVAGARMLRRLYEELADKQIDFRVVGAHAEVRDRLRFEKLQESVGPINRHVSLSEAVALGNTE